MRHGHHCFGTSVAVDDFHGPLSSCRERVIIRYSTFISYQGITIKNKPTSFTKLQSYLIATWVWFFWIMVPWNTSSLKIECQNDSQVKVPSSVLWWTSGHLSTLLAVVPYSYWSSDYMFSCRVLCCVLCKKQRVTFSRFWHQSTRKPAYRPNVSCRLWIL